MKERLKETLNKKFYDKLQNKNTPNSKTLILFAGERDWPKKLPIK